MWRTPREKSCYTGTPSKLANYTNFLTFITLILISLIIALIILIHYSHICHNTSLIRPDQGPANVLQRMYVLSSFVKFFKTPSESCCRTCKRLCWDRFENPGGAILLTSISFPIHALSPLQMHHTSPSGYINNYIVFFFFYTPSEFVWMGLVIPRRYTMDPGCTYGIGPY